MESVLPLTLTAVVVAAAGLGTAASIMRLLGPKAAGWRRLSRGAGAGLRG